MPETLQMPISLAVPDALSAGGLQIDREAGVIRGVSIITAGAALGHGFEIDAVMLRQVADAINAKPKGTKARLTHPGRGIFDTRDAAEVMLGRVRGARIDGNRVRGDLHLSAFAAKSPSGDLRDYVLSVAEEDPEIIGLSISFEPAPFVGRSDPHTKQTLPPLGRVRDVLAVDVVGDPAANAGGLLSRGTTMTAATTAPASTTTAPDNNAPADSVALERSRASEIRGLAQLTGLPDNWALEAITSGMSLQEAMAVAQRKRAAERAPLPQLGVGSHTGTITGGQDGRVSLAAGMTDAIALRYGARIEKPADRAQQFRHLSLLEMGREFLTQLGVDTAAMSRAVIARTLMNRGKMAAAGVGGIALAHSTGDFPTILGDALGKRLRSGYDEGPATWPLWARRTTAPDFKQIKRPILGESATPIKMNEGAEYTYATLGEKNEVYGLAQYGRGFTITWQALVNDDMDAFSGIVTRFGAACRRLEDDVAYAPITGNQVMTEDNKALFHTDHANTATAAAPTLATIAAGRTKIRLQKGIGGAVLNLTPAHILVPVELEDETRQLVASTVDPTKSNPTPNFESVRALNVVAEARLSVNSATRWYLACPTSQIDTMEVCFLEGEERPFIDMDDDFDTDDRKYKCRHVVAARAIDFRGLFRNG